jgi:hypothetical protein
MDWEYLRFLAEMGFSWEQAEKIVEGKSAEVLTEEELLLFASAWENDKVEPMKSLVEKYGWQGLAERLEASIAD